MAGFLYFIDGVLRDEPETAADHDIAYAFEGRPSARGVRAEGPSGGPGNVLVQSTPDYPMSLFGYFPEKQTWRQVPNSQVWIGMANDHPPTPDDLKRKSQLKGKTVELNDNRWLVPTARSWIEQDGDARWIMDLPQKRELNGDGKWHPGGVISKYATLWGYAEAYWSLYTGADAEEGEKVELTYSDATDAMIVALQTNYRIGAHECIMLDLTSDDNVSSVLNALVSFQDFVDIVTKKKPPQRTTNTKGGRKEKTERTAQPA